MKSRQSHSRIQATITKQVGPRAVACFERNVIAITRRIHTLERNVKTAKRQLAEMQKELRFKRRELRAVLQRDASLTDDDPKLLLARTPDAIDASDHARERGK